MSPLMFLSIKVWPLMERRFFNDVQWTWMDISLYVQFFSCSILQLVTKFIFMFISIYIHSHSFAQSLLPLKSNLLVLCTGGCFLIMGRTWWINSWDIDSSNLYFEYICESRQGILFQSWLWRKILLFSKIPRFSKNWWGIFHLK